ncbi:MAG: translocation and assembly module TamB, partial [Paracoccaceae bacterium]
MVTHMSRFPARLFTVLMLSCALLLANGAVAQFSFGGIKNSLIQFALKQISVEGVFEIRAAGIEQPEDGVTDLVGVEIIDRDGVWLTAEALSLRWNARAILSGELDIERLAARGLKVLRRPIPAEVTVNPDAEIAQGPSRGLLDWPRSPITLKLQELSIDGAFIAAGVAVDGASIAFDARGSARDAGDVQAADLVITRTDDVAGRIDFAFARNFTDQSLMLKLNADEAAGGIVAALIGLPASSAASAQLNADGPLADWRAAFTAAAQDVLSIEGAGTFDVTGPLDAEASLTVRSGPLLGADAAAVIGAQAKLDIKVSEDDKRVVTVQAGRLRSPAISADASGRYDKATGAMDFDVSLAVTAAMARLADGVDFTALSFDGNLKGTPDDLSAVGDLQLTGLTTGPVDLGTAALSVNVAKTADIIVAAVSGAAEGVRLDKLGPDLMGATDLSVTGRWDGAARRADLDMARIASPLLTVTAAGMADIAKDLADLRWTLSTPDLAPVAAAYGQDAAGRLSAQGRAEGALSAPHLIGALTAQALRVGAERLGEVALSHDVTLGAAPAGRITLRARGGPLGPADITTDFALADGVLIVSDLTAKVLEAQVTGRATVDTATGLTDADLTVNAPRLSALAPVFQALKLGAPPRGAVRGDVALRHAGGAQNADLKLTAERIDTLDYGLSRMDIDASARDLLGTPEATGTLRADGIFGPDGLAVARLTVDGGAFDLTGAPQAEASLTADGITAPGGIALARLTLSGKGTDLTGAPSATLSFDAQGLTGPDGLSVARASGDARGADLTGDPSVTLKAAIDTIAAADATIARADITADMRGLTGGAPHGTARITTGAIVAGGATIAKTALDLDLTNGSAGATDLRATLTAPGLRSGDARLGAITVRAAVADALGAPRVDVTADVAGGSVGGAALARITASAKGPLNALALALSVKGALPDGRAAMLDMTATADAGGETITATVPRLTAEVAQGAGRDPDRAIRVALDRPLRVTSGPSGQRFDDIAISLPGGRLTGRAALVGGGARGALTLTMDDLRPIARIAKAPIEAGSMTASADFDTAAGRATLVATGASLRFDAIDARETPLALDLTGIWRGGRLKATGALTGGFGNPMAFDADLPLVANGLVPVVPQNGRLDAGVKWSGRIGPLWALVPAPDHILDGLLDMDLRVAGRVSAPQPAGQLRLSDGRYENLETGTILTDLRVTTGLAANNAMTLDLAAQDGSGAPVTGKAVIEGGRIDASLITKSAVLVRRDDATAAISMDITASGPLASPAITGNVVIDRAEIRLISTTPPAVASLGEIEIKGEPPRKAEETSANGGPTLDLSIRAPGNIFVRGRGLTSEWEADLKVRGSASAPIITGA